MKRKKMPTQRQKTFRRAVAVAALLAILAALRGYNFTRDQARREMEDRYGLGETQVVKELGDLPVGSGKRTLYYAVNRDVTIIYALEFDIKLGWDWAGCVVTDNSGGAAASAGLLLLEASPGGETAAYCFGQVEDPEMEHLVFRSMDPDSGTVLTGESVSQRSEWATRSQKRYFAFSVSTATGDMEGSQRLELSGYDGEGRTVFQQELQADRRTVFD